MKLMKTTKPARTVTAERPSKQRGSALVLVLLFSLVVTAFGTSLLISSHTEHLISANERDSERAYYAAQAGVTYGYYRHAVIKDLAVGDTFSSADDGVEDELNGGYFEGQVTTAPGLQSLQGQVFRITATGRCCRGAPDRPGRSQRNLSMDYKLVGDAFRFGFLAVGQLALRNNAQPFPDMSAPAPFNEPGVFLQPDDFQMQATLYSSRLVELPRNLQLDGTIVSASRVTWNDGDGARLIRGEFSADIFANEVTISGDPDDLDPLNVNGPVVEGNVRTLAAVVRDDDGMFDIRDNLGVAYDWFVDPAFPSDPRDSPGDVNLSNGAEVLGDIDDVQVMDGDVFEMSIFRPNGSLDPNPDLNVIQAFQADDLKIDYQGLYREATEEGESNTFYTSLAALMTEIDSRMTGAPDDSRIEVGFDCLSGDPVERRVARFGTEDIPELIYLEDTFCLRVMGWDGVLGSTSTMGTDPISGQDCIELNADAFWLEGGIYATGDIIVNTDMHRPCDTDGFHSNDPVWGDADPSEFKAFRVDGLSHCLPALIAYAEPGSIPNPADPGDPRDEPSEWVPEDTPALQNLTGAPRQAILFRSNLNLRSPLEPTATDYGCVGDCQCGERWLNWDDCADPCCWPDVPEDNMGDPRATIPVTAGDAPGSWENGLHEGFVEIIGMTLSQGDTEMQHFTPRCRLTNNVVTAQEGTNALPGNDWVCRSFEDIFFRGAELGFRVTNSNYFNFQYDPRVVCTRYILSQIGQPQVVAYVEDIAPAP